MYERSWQIMDRVSFAKLLYTRSEPTSIPYSNLPMMRRLTFWRDFFYEWCGGVCGFFFIKEDLSLTIQESIIIYWFEV